MPTRLTRGRRFPRPLTIVLASLGGLLVLAVGAVTVFALVVGRTYDSGRHVVDAFPDAGTRPQAATGKAAGAVNILLIGRDVDTADPESPQFVGKREADTLMLLHVPADRSKIYTVSILRNSLVDVPGHGMQPINSSYAYGNVKLTVQTVEQLLDVRVDHVVDISLRGVKDLTDALGGVTVNNRAAFSHDGYTFTVGKHHLSGTAALAYMRAGDFHASGDGVRAQAQEAYFRAVFDQVLSAKILLDPAGIASAVSIFSPYVSTDSGFDSGTIASLGLSLRGVGGGDLTSLRVAQSGIGVKDGATVVLIDQDRLSDLKKDLRKDALQDYKG